MLKRQKQKEIMQDHKYWKEIERYLPWKLHGFNYRRNVSFFTSPVKSTGTALGDALCLPRTNPWAMIELTGEQRDQIIAAIRRSK